VCDEPAARPTSPYVVPVVWIESTLSRYISYTDAPDAAVHDTYTTNVPHPCGVETDTTGASGAAPVVSIVLFEEVTVEFVVPAVVVVVVVVPDACVVADVGDCVFAVAVVVVAVAVAVVVVTKPVVPLVPVEPTVLVTCVVEFGVEALAILDGPEHPALTQPIT
jgi:hypothetical protein